MDIDHKHLSQLVMEMERGVSATTKYSYLDLAKEVLRLQRKMSNMCTDVHNLRMEMNRFIAEYNG